MRTALFLILMLVLAGGGAAYYVTHVAADPPASFRTATVKRGDLFSTISATGTAEPEEVVDVGAQVVGRIKSLGPDPGDPQKKKTIDYGSAVQDGTILALIDDSMYKAQADQASASLARAKADLLQMQAKVEQTKQEWKRAESLRSTKAIADTDFDLAVANYKVAQANLAVGEAAVKQSEAALQMAQTSFDYTIIKSPVQGVIIDRRVNVGQTVVASLNAPSLFLIAKDLRRMQVWASVNEADIGRIKPGLPVRFTVDAYPGETFRGKVAQIRLNATMTQNVVTYTVVVETDNSDLRLLPYLTANLQFEIDEHRNVLLVPNAALRWKPRPQLVAPDVRETVFPTSSQRGGGSWGKSSAKSGGEATSAGDAKPSPERAVRGSPDGAVRGSPDPAQGPTEGLQKPQGRPAVDDSAGSGDPRRAQEPSSEAKPSPEAKSPGETQSPRGTKSRGEGKSGKPAKEREDRGRLWVQEGDFVRPIDVEIGASDGSQTAVSGTAVSEGMEVVIGEVRKEDRADGGDTTNPFMPKLFRGCQKKSQP
jgi:HlyD family secretion protein